MKKIKQFAPFVLGAYINCMALFTKKRMMKKAFKLFCTPRKGKVLAKQIGYLDAAKYDLLAVGNTSVQTYCWPGDNTTVLLMHGWESNSFRWHKLIPVLQKEGYNIIAFDAPAHGNTSGKILNAPLYSSCAQFIIEKFKPNYIIGHSFGGMTLLYNQFIHQNPGVKKIITLGAPAELADVMRQFQALLGLSTRVMKGLDDCFLQQFGFNFADFSSIKFAQSITTTGLLIHDELDNVASINCSEQVHASWKNSTLIKTKGLGHSLSGKKVRDQIVSFLVTIQHDPMPTSKNQAVYDQKEGA